MSGLACGSTTAFDGSQFHQGAGYFDDPLGGQITIFMNSQIPAAFGPVTVPFATGVTALTGTGYNALAAIPTIPLPLPFAVDILISNVPQRWFLVAGVFPGTPGTTQPNDYNAVTNARYWVQLM